MTEIRKVSTGFQRELTSALEAEERKAEPPMKPQSPGGPQDVSSPSPSPEADAPTTAPADDAADESA